MTALMKIQDDEANIITYEIYATNVSDIASLPTMDTEGEIGGKKYRYAPFGSYVLCFEDSNIYMLSEGGWQLL